MRVFNGYLDFSLNQRDCGKGILLEIQSLFFDFIKNYMRKDEKKREVIPEFGGYMIGTEHDKIAGLYVKPQLSQCQ